MKTVTKTLLIHQVVIDQSQDVTLFCQFENRKAPVAYLGISLRNLNTLLMQIGAGGLKLLEFMAYAIMECNEAPSLVQVSNTLGLPLVVDVPAELIFASAEKDVYFYG